MAKKIFILLIIILIGIQFIPVERTNPPVKGEIDAPGDIKKILQKSCYDCHSNKTDWPWYSHVAPISFLVVKDVEEGRRHVNFTEWDKYSAKDWKEIINETVEEIEEGDMPLPIYTFIHPSAKINDVELKKLKNWAAKYSLLRFH